MAWGSPGGCCVSGRLNLWLTHFALNKQTVWACFMSCGHVAWQRVPGPGRCPCALGCAGRHRGPTAAPLPHFFCNRLHLPAVEFVFSPSWHVNYFTGQQSLVRTGPTRWLDDALSPCSHGNPSIPGAGCFITGDVKLDHCSHTSKPAGLPEMYLYLGSAALLYSSLSFSLLLSFSDKFTFWQPSH